MYGIESDEDDDALVFTFHGLLMAYINPRREKTKIPLGQIKVSKDSQG